MIGFDGVLIDKSKIVDQFVFIVLDLGMLFGN